MADIKICLFLALFIAIIDGSNAGNERASIDVRAVSYDGEWYGYYDGHLRGTIAGIVLTWGNGVQSSLQIDEMGSVYLGPDALGMTYIGMMMEPGLINWNDGDIWINPYAVPDQDTTAAPAPCWDEWETKKCEKRKAKGKCDKKKVAQYCQKTCGHCTSANATTEVYPEPCYPNPCWNGGICKMVGQSETCECPPGFEGETCQTETSTEVYPEPCYPNPCLNGGTCQIVGQSETCECPPDFAGDFCENSESAQSNWNGPTSNIWGDDQCTMVGGLGPWWGHSALTADQCKQGCEMTPGCNAINYGNDGNCVFRECAFLVPVPSWNFVGFSGYYIGAEPVESTPVIATTQAPPPTKDPTLPRTVLWLGNSYTYVNDMPKMVQSLASHDGKTIIYDQHTNGGWTMGDHAASATSINKINSQKWDVVILQEQSQLPAFGEMQVCEQSVRPIQSLSSAIRDNSPDTVIQFFGTWGRPDGSIFGYMQDLLTLRYELFACMVPAPARMVPVGEAFRKSEELYGTDARLGLYSPPGDHHSSVAGTYLGACMHFLGIYGGNVVGNPYTGGLDANLARGIQEIAQQVYEADDLDFATDAECQQSMCSYF